MQSTAYLSILVTLLSTVGALAQSNIDPVNKSAWSENVGWMNWRDANSGENGVRVLPTILSGYIWAENVGWINVGDGTPTNGVTYANSDSTDYGVNIDPDGSLTYVEASEDPSKNLYALGANVLVRTSMWKRDAGKG